MPKLKNARHELLAQNVVASNFNKTKAYLRTYPDSSYASAHINAGRITNDIKVKERIEEIANRKGLTVEFEIDNIMADHLATRPVVVNKKLVDYPDYGVRLEAAKTGLKLHGFLQNDGNTINNIDNRSVSVSLASNDVSMLNSTLLELKALASAGRTECESIE